MVQKRDSLEIAAIGATWLSIGLMALSLAGCQSTLGMKLTDAARAAAQCLPEFATCVVGKYKASQNVSP